MAAPLAPHGSSSINGGAAASSYHRKCLIKRSCSMRYSHQNNRALSANGMKAKYRREKRKRKAERNGISNNI